MAQAYSAAYETALKYGSNLAQAQITVYTNGQPTSYLVPISDASITVSRNASYRRQGSITVELLPGDPLVPLNPNSTLAPFGNEVFVQFTAVPLGTVPTSADWVPVGLFPIATTTVEDSVTDLLITLDLYDRSWVIDQRAFLAPYNIPATESGTLAAEIEYLANLAWTSWGTTSPTPLVFNLPPDSPDVPAGLSYSQGDSPWQAIQDMAQDCGWEVFFDVNGVLTGYPIPDPSTQPVVWNFAPNTISSEGTYTYPVGGSPYTTPTGVTSTMTRDQIYNDFWVIGTGPQNADGSSSGSTEPVTGEAQDTNPSSATYIDGPMGDIPTFVQSSVITTDEAAQDSANYNLAQSISQAWQITVSSSPNAIFDIDDVVTATDPNLGLSATKFVIDTIDFDVRYDSITQITGRVVP